MSPKLVPTVTSMGYSTFEETCHTDHRQIHVDLDLQQLLDGPSHPLDTPTGRSLQAKKTSSVTKYILAAHQHLDANNLFSQLFTLQRATTPQPELAEKLDRLLLQACKTGENSCRRTPRPWWSTKIHQQRRWVSMLSRHQSGLRRQQNKRVALQQKLVRQGVTNQLPETLPECHLQLKTAPLELRTMIQTSRQLREEEQISRFREHLSSSSPPKTRTQILKSIHHKERTAAMYTKFRATRRDASHMTLTTLQVPQDWPIDHLPQVTHLSDPQRAATWQSIEDPETLRSCIAVRNYKHFGQAQGTPFTELPLSEDIDWHAGTKTADLYLAGKCSTSDFELATHLILRQCRQSTTLDSIPAHIAQEEYKSKFKVWCERTTTSPSGRHLGHFKALFARSDLEPDTEEHQEFTTCQQALLDAYISLLNYATNFRHVYDRWRDIVNIMIHKKPGDHRIHRLRVIHIYEADYNFLFGTKWRAAIHQAERETTLHPEQYGGRPGREASALALLEELKVGISYAARRSLITFDNDASSCYDRIIPSLASLAGRKYGLHKNLVYLNAETLRTARYHLKTATGVSPEWTSHSTVDPIYGTGQGSGNSPVIWTLISSILFAAHQSKAHGAFFTDPQEQLQVLLSIVRFVDDSTGQANDFASRIPYPAEELLRWMAHDGQLWTDLSWASSGLLELPKCSFHFLHFEFRSDGMPRPTISHHSDHLTVKDSATGRHTSITSKSVFDAHKILGHYKAPAGSSATQFEQLRTKGRSLLQALNNRMRPTPEETRTFYSAIFLPLRALEKYKD